MARGGDGYSAFAGVEPLVPLDDAPLLANEVMVYLRELGTRAERRSTAASSPNRNAAAHCARRRLQ